jgi:hypothetical protein
MGVWLKHEALSSNPKPHYLKIKLKKTETGKRKKKEGTCLSLPFLLREMRIWNLIISFNFRVITSKMVLCKIKRFSKLKYVTNYNFTP